MNAGIVEGFAVLKVSSFQVARDDDGDNRGDVRCDDACHPHPEKSSPFADGFPNEIRVAVSDGVSNTSFSGIWSNLLVSAYMAGDLGAGVSPKQLLAYQLQWWDRVTTAWPNLTGTPLLMARRGASATFLGLSIRPEPSGGGGVWRAEARGDSCLALVRSRIVDEKFPLKSASQFGQLTPAISTGRFTNGTLADTDGNRPVEAITSCCGSAVPGDTFFLMTDALAKWFYSAHEKGESPWEDLTGFAELREFAEWVRLKRKSGELENDDVTMVLARYSDEDC